MFEKLYIKLKKTPFIRGRLSGEIYSVTRENEIPKKIFIYWNQGEDKAPDLCKACINSWRDYNPEWEVNVLDQQEANKILNIEEYNTSLTQAAYSDALRVALLSKYGGVWVDATVACHSKLDSWLPHLTLQSGFFAFYRPGVDRLIASWFLASSKNNYITNRWHTSTQAYLRKLTDKPKAYFWFHYIFELNVLKNKKFRKMWRKVPKVSASASHYFQKSLKAEASNPYIQINQNSFMQKLNYKSGFSFQDYVDSYEKRSE